MVRESCVLDVLPDRGDRLGAQIGERAMFGPLAERLDPDAAAAGEQIQHVHPFNSRTQHIKKRCLDPVEDRPSPPTGDQE
jgi:hypothetical protein